jgi:hypothetical protein
LSEREDVRLRTRIASRERQPEKGDFLIPVRPMPPQDEG